MSSKKEEPPQEVKEMHDLLAEVRRSARSVKDSARNLRVVRKGDRLAELTDEDMKDYDSRHPPKDGTDKHVL